MDGLISRAGAVESFVSCFASVQLLPFPLKLPPTEIGNNVEFRGSWVREWRDNDSVVGLFGKRRGGRGREGFNHVRVGIEFGGFLGG